MGWGEYVDELVARLRREGRDGEGRRSVAEAVSVATEAVARLLGAVGEARHVRSAAMRLAFAGECIGSDRVARVPADLPPAALLGDALRLVAAAHDALHVGVRHQSPVPMLAQVRARRQLRAAYDALSRERAARLERTALP
jgi:hypothetical protein